MTAPNEPPVHFAALATQLDGILANLAAGRVRIGTTWYATSGAFASKSLGAEGRVIAFGGAGAVWNLPVSWFGTPPPSAPSGWVYTYHVLDTSGYVTVGTAAGYVRLVCPNHQAPSVQVGWRLVRAS